MPRKATWAILIWTGFWILMTYLLTQATGQVGAECASEAQGELGEAICDDAAIAAGGFWFVIGFLIWFVGFAILALIYLGTRPQRRLCPACGNQVKKGRTQCPKCGFDFRVAAGMVPPPPTPPQTGWR